MEQGPDEATLLKKSELERQIKSSVSVLGVLQLWK